MPHANVNGVKLYYEDVGQGLPLVFAHGGGGSLLQWAFQLPFFSKRHRAIAYDSRGHGRSESPETGYGLEVFSRDLLGLIDSLGLDRVVLVGLTMGGMTGLQFALDHPDRLHGLVLVGVSDGGRQAMQERFEMSADIAEMQGMEMLAEGFCSVVFSPWFLEEQREFVETFRKSMLESSPRGYAHAIRALARRPRLGDRLAGIRVNTLIVVGEDDVTEFPLEDAPLFAEQIPGSRLVKLPRAGHLACIEQPSVFNETLEDFLKGMGP